MRREYLRQLPYVGEDPAKLIRVPGLGTFVVQSVGNCAGTTGLDAYFQAEGALECELGCVRHSLKFTDAGHPYWERQPGRWKEIFFAPKVEEELLRIVIDTPQRDPYGYMFHVLGALDKELRQHEYEVKKRQNYPSLYGEPKVYLRKWGARRDVLQRISNAIRNMPTSPRDYAAIPEVMRQALITANR
jgi:hypothetical protein